MNHSMLEHFLAAYEQGSLGRAAAVLGLSQPALSKSIRKLEQSLEVPLFERTTHGMRPTLYGETLARRGHAIQSDIRSSIAELQKLKNGEAGEVRMGTAPALSPHFLPRVIATIHGMYPSLSLTVSENLYETLARQVETGESDFALTTMPFSGRFNGLEIEELFQDRFVVCCSSRHPLASKRAVQPRDLFDYPWIMPPREGLVWQRFVDLFARLGSAAPKPLIETNSSGLIKRMLGGGTFLSFVPTQLVFDEQARGELVALQVPGIVLQRSIAIVSRKGRVHPMAATLVLSACRAIAAEVDVQLKQRPTRAGAAKETS
jgi:DNA-binding transcriptional LysR family regulator